MVEKAIAERMRNREIIVKEDERGEAEGERMARELKEREGRIIRNKQSRLGWWPLPVKLCGAGSVSAVVGVFQDWRLAPLGCGQAAIDGRSAPGLACT